MHPNRARSDFVEHFGQLDVLLVHEEKGVVIQLLLHSLHIVVNEPLHHWLLHVLWPEEGEGIAVEVDAIVFNHSSDEWIVPLGAKGCFENGEDYQTLYLQYEFSNEVNIILEHVDLDSLLYSLEDVIRQFDITEAFE